MPNKYKRCLLFKIPTDKDCIRLVSMGHYGVIFCFIVYSGKMGTLYSLTYRHHKLKRSFTRGVSVGIYSCSHKTPIKHQNDEFRLLSVLVFLPIAQQLGTEPCGIAWQHNGQSCGAGTWRTSPCKQCNPEKKLGFI